MAVYRKIEKDAIAEKMPFNIEWLNSSYQETLLPNAPWHPIEHKISVALAARVEKQFSRIERKEALIQTLGQPFVTRYLPDTVPTPEVLEPPQMTIEDKNKIQKEAQAYINSQVYKVAKEIGYQRMLGIHTNGEQVPDEYGRFLEHTFNVFHRGLDRELYRQETYLAKKKKEELIQTAKIEKLIRIPVPSRIKPATAASDVSAASTIKPSSPYVKQLIHKVEGDPPPLWGSQSDCIGKSVVNILQRDPRKFERVAGRMHGRQLPGNLRAYIWTDVLFRAERKRLPEVNLERVIRERFAKAVTRGVSELKINRATYSPISGLIQNAVFETYNKTTAMVAFKTERHMKETSRALNVLYVYDRSYEPYLIHWLFPLQVAFQITSTKTAEIGQHAYELAMFLDLLNSSCFPTWPQVFAIAEQVMHTLSLSDPDLYTHLKSIATLNVQVNKKEFLLQLISVEKAKAEELLKATPGGMREQQMSTELLADPLVFLRRWIGEGFVSVLDTPAVMYIWDQCFMQGWQPSVMKNFCLALMELLRSRFMEAKDYNGMKRVFLFEPCKLYTMDIQMAWIHLERGNDLLEIPFLNRQRPPTPSIDRMSQEPVSKSPSVELSGFLQPCGIKDIMLKLIIPSESVERHPFLSKVEAKNIKLHVAVYFGSIRLRSRMSLSKPYATNIEKDNYGNTWYEVFFPDDKYVFDNLDLTHYDVERELGAYPYAIVKVEYYIPGPPSKATQPVPVGWARIPLFQKGARTGRTSVDSTVDVAPHWVLQAGDLTFTLHPGEVPESLVATQPLTPSDTDIEGNILGYNSELLGIVYDPRNEPAGKGKPAVAAPIPSESPTPQVPPSDTRHQRPSPVTSSNPWVEHKPALSASLQASGLQDTFDLYVDSVRFIPDNASIVKVTGVIGAPASPKILLALPDLEGSARSPQFQYRVVYNEERKNVDKDMVAFLRVYTMDISTDMISVVGSCFLPIFKDGKLNVGGHQLHLRNGIPPSKPKYVHTDLDFAPAVPACSILVRLLPHADVPVPAPKYGSGFYHSESCRPNESEKRIFESYKEHMMYPKTVREMIQRLQQASDTEMGRSEDELLDWLQERLDVKRLGERVAAPNLPLEGCIRYKIKNGLYVKINQAYGLPDGLYIHCFANVAPGSKVLGMSPTPEGNGKEEKFVTLEHDYNSLQNSPIWLDEPKELHPFYDPYSCLVIQLFGLDVLYRPRPDHDEAGTVHTLKGAPLTLGDDQIIGWTAVSLFDLNSVMTGIHEVPLFKGKPPEGILEDFTTDNVENVLASYTWNKNNRYESASLSVTIWDGHYDFDDVPVLYTYENTIQAVGKLDLYKKARQLKKGKRIYHFIVDNLETKYKKQETNSAIYKKEQEFFEKLIMDTFYGLMKEWVRPFYTDSQILNMTDGQLARQKAPLEKMSDHALQEDALMNAGYGPL